MKAITAHSFTMTFGNTIPKHRQSMFQLWIIRLYPNAPGKWL